MPAAQPRYNRLNGRLQLEFLKKHGKTKLTKSFQSAPLKASHVFYNGDDGANMYVMDSSGGMVSGDTHQYEISVGDEAKVELFQQSALKVYPAIDNRGCEQTMQICLGKNSAFVWRPESIIPFATSRFRNNVQITMEPSATLCWGEIYSPGRVQSGESFQYGELTARFEVWQQDKCVVYDAIRLSPERMNPNHIGVFSHYHYFGSFYFISPAAKSCNIETIASILPQTNVITAGVTQLHSDIIHARWLATDLWALKKELNKMFTTMMVLN